MRSLLIAALMLFIAPFASASQEYLIGAGLGETTGPTVGVETMGYGNPYPVGSGLHQRLWSRSFVVADAQAPDYRVAISTIEHCFVTIALKQEVIRILQQHFGTDVYHHGNVLISSTHTHSAPAGISSFKFYNNPTGGMVRMNFDFMAKGIADSIIKADKNLEPGTIRFGAEDLDGVTVNRSMAAFQNNPEHHANGSNVDTKMSLIRFDSARGEPLGMLNWFAIHGTSMDKRNSLISGDNKGFAAYLFERWQKTKYHGQKTFVAAFANSNAGDASPNVDKDVDGDGDWECQANDNFLCAERSGRAQFEAARSAFENAAETISGPIGVRHRFVNFSRILLPKRGGEEGDLPPLKTCRAAIGVSMIAGSAEDGPGVGREGQSCKKGRGILVRRGCRARFVCHGQKPVLLQTGLRGQQPELLPTQIIQIGSLALAAVPAEMTTMSGRRLDNALRKALEPAGVDKVIIAAYANGYSSYISTREEYQEQHYEGASTLFGEYTLNAYVRRYLMLARSLLHGEPVGGEATPTIDLDRVPQARISMQYQRPRGRFGEVIARPSAQYQPGEVARVVFNSGHPNHMMGVQKSQIEVQKQEGESWRTVLEDWDWYTRYQWGDGKGSAQWAIQDGTDTGIYRFVHRGRKSKGDKVYEAVSPTFEVK